MNEVVRHGGGASALAIRPEQSDWTPEQAQALLEMFNLGDAPHAVIRSYFHVAQSTGLDPFKRQVHLIERKGRWTPQTSIDGFRIIRDRSGVYDGDETFWCGEDGVWVDAWLRPEPPTACKFMLYVKGRSRPVQAVARWSEYVQTTRTGETTSMWARMSAHMLAKVAEALAIRKAFPDDTGGLYTDDEMAQASNEIEATPSRGGRQRSPGIMDLETPPEPAPAARPAPQGVGGGFMDAPPADDPNVEDAQVVEDEPVSQPEAHAAEPTAADDAPVGVDAGEPASSPENAAQESQGAPLDMNPQPDPGPALTNPWSTKLAEALEDPQFDLYRLRLVYDEAAAEGALGEPVPWAGGSFDDAVQAIRANLESGRDPVAGIG